MADRTYHHLGDVSLTIPTLQRLAVGARAEASKQDDRFVQTELYNFASRCEAIVQKEAPADDWLAI